jgi:hypothetical protein
VFTDSRQAIHEAVLGYRPSSFVTLETPPAALAKEVLPPEPPPGEIMRPSASPELPLDQDETLMVPSESRTGDIRNGPGSSEAAAAPSEDRMIVPELGAGSQAHRFALR